jgi:ABC-type transport system involved in multi-copper enzyme maturation permease subunit
MIQEWMSDWLTPIWLLSVGCLFGQLLLLIFWGVAFAVGAMNKKGAIHRMAAELPLAVTEGPLKPIMVVVTIASIFGLAGWMVVEQPKELVDSLRRIHAAGVTTESYEIAPTPRDTLGKVQLASESKVDVGIWGDEIKRIEFRSDQQLTISARPIGLEGIQRVEITVLADEVFTWKKGENQFLNDEFVDSLYVANGGREPANLSADFSTSPKFTQVYAIPITALLVCLIAMMYLAMRTFAPRLSGIALSTYKSEIAQPLFPILAALGCFLIVVFVFVPYNTFGDDIKMMKDTSFSLILVFCLIQLMWAAGTSVSDEIEGRTALTVLSKPIGRRSFLLGKFAGISWVVFLLFAALSVAFILSVAYKPIYDGRELSKGVEDWQPCFSEIYTSFPGLVLVLLEVLLLTAVSVAVSTRLSLMANFIVCSSIYVLGHLTPHLVQSSLQQFTIVRFFARLIATVVPNLETFNITAAIAADAYVPPAYLIYAFMYSLIYSVIAMLLAFFLFEDRDLT